MASLRSCNVTRSAASFRRAAVSAHHQYAENMSERSHPSNMRPFFTWSSLFLPKLPDTKPSYVSVDQYWMKSQISCIPGANSLSLTRVDGQYLIIQAPVPEMSNSTSAEGISVLLNINQIKDVGDVIATVEGEYLLIQANSDGATYLTGMKLPSTWKRNSGFNGVLRNGSSLLLTLPMEDSIFPVIRNELFTFMRSRILRSTALEASVETLFDYSHLRRLLFPGIAHPEERCASFTFYKKQIGENLYVKMSTGIEDVELTTEGLCVSLRMPGLKMVDVSFSFENDTILIQGKTESEHYVGGMLIPVGFETKVDLIKAKMHQGVYTVTLPRKNTLENM